MDREICIFENADNTIRTAANSFCEVVKTVSGETYDVRLIVSCIQATGIVLATFSQTGVLNARLNDLSNACAQDGFCVTQDEKNIWILSHTSRGVYYGVHAFLERNLPVIFSRGAREESLQYVSVSNCAWKETEILENCPFAVRSWNLCGIGSSGKGHFDDGTAEYLARNGANATFHALDETWRAYGLFHNGKRVKSVQVFDDVATIYPEYFMTDADGKPRKAFGGYESFPNYYNQEVAEFLAKRLVAEMPTANDEDIYHWTMPDNSYFYMQENGQRLHELPFTCDDGTVVYPDEPNYKSTVYFNFLNRVLRAANRLRPNTYLQAFAYIYSETAPKIDVDEHLIVMVAPIQTNDKYSYIDSATKSNERICANIKAWSEKTKNLHIYTYWQSFQGASYSRPILRVVQENLLWFQKLGIRGVTVEAAIDCSYMQGLSESQKHSRLFYDMNEAYIWAISKLMWNPALDIDELLAKYATIVYKECSEEMREYFRLLQQGWDSTDANVWYTTGGDVYYLQFVIGAGLAQPVLQTLKRALEKAKTPAVKRKVSAIYEVVVKEITKYQDFVKEEAFVRYCGGKDVLTENNLDYVHNADSPWNKAKALTVLRYSRNMEYYPKETNFSCRMLYDDENIYVGYTLFDSDLAYMKETDGRKRYFRTDGSEVIAVSETYIGGDIFNQSVYFGYISGFMDITRKEQGEFYQNDGAIKSIPLPKGVRTVSFVHLDGEPTRRYHFHVQVIPFTAVGENVSSAKPYGSFSYVSNRYGCAGWMGYGLWCKQNFQPFGLEKIKRSADDGKSNQKEK